MDNKTKWLGMAIVVGLIMLWQGVIVPQLAKKNNWDLTGASQKKVEPEQVATTTAPTTGATGVATTGAAATGPTTNVTAGFQGGPPTTQPIVLGNNDYQGDAKDKSPFTIGLSLSPRGASIESVP